MQAQNFIRSSTTSTCCDLLYSLFLLHMICIATQRRCVLAYVCGKMRLKHGVCGTYTVYTLLLARCHTLPTYPVMPVARRMNLACFMHECRLSQPNMCPQGAHIRLQQDGNQRLCLRPSGPDALPITPSSRADSKACFMHQCRLSQHTGRLPAFVMRRDSKTVLAPSWPDAMPVSRSSHATSKAADSSTAPWSLK